MHVKHGTTGSAWWWLVRHKSRMRIMVEHESVCGTFATGRNLGRHVRVCGSSFRTISGCVLIR